MNLEKAISNYLNKFPRIKSIIRSIYCRPFTWYGSLSDIYLCENCLMNIRPEANSTFFGYYDHYPENTNKLAYHSTDFDTHLPPSRANLIDLRVVSLADDKIIYRDKISTFNWQQGARIAWIDSSKIIYNNSTDNQRNKIVMVNPSKPSDISTVFDFHYQAHDQEYIYSINYQYIATLRPDYGYFNKQISNKEIANLDETQEGLFACSRITKNFKCLVSLQRVRDNLKVNKNNKININHVLTHHKKSGEIIFIVREFTSTGRTGYLMYYDLETDILTCLIGPGIISHFCWYDDDTIFGYFETPQNGLCYQTINILTLECCSYSWIDKYTGGDGHPTIVDGKYLITDTYPDRYGIQRLFAINLLTKKSKLIFSAHHPLRFRNQGRCDFHPRVKNVNSPIYIDAIVNGIRSLVSLEFNFDEL